MLAPEMFITNETTLFPLVLSKLKLKFPVFVLTKDHLLQPI